jgi:hypothetical protein
LNGFECKYEHLTCSSQLIERHIALSPLSKLEMVVSPFEPSQNATSALNLSETAESPIVWPRELFERGRVGRKKRDPVIGELGMHRAGRINEHREVFLRP